MSQVSRPKVIDSQRSETQRAVGSHLGGVDMGQNVLTQGRHLGVGHSCVVGQLRELSSFSWSWLWLTRFPQSLHQYQSHLHLLCKLFHGGRTNLSAFFQHLVLCFGIYTEVGSTHQSYGGLNKVFTISSRSGSQKLLQVILSKFYSCTNGCYEQNKLLLLEVALFSFFIHVAQKVCAVKYLVIVAVYHLLGVRLSAKRVIIGRIIPRPTPPRALRRSRGHQIQQLTDSFVSENPTLPSHT